MLTEITASYRSDLLQVGSITHSNSETFIVTALLVSVGDGGVPDRPPSGSGRVTCAGFGGLALWWPALFPVSDHQRRVRGIATLARHPRHQACSPFALFEGFMVLEYVGTIVMSDTSQSEATESDDYCERHELDYGKLPGYDHCPKCREERRVEEMEQERMARRSDSDMHPTIDAPRR